MIIYIVLGIAILVGVLLVVFVWKPWESKDEKTPIIVQEGEPPKMEVPKQEPYTGSVPTNDRPVLVTGPVEPIDPKTLPGLVGLYLATSYDEAAGVWRDESGKNNHTSKVRGRPKLNTSGPFPYVHGGTGDGLQFPQPAILPYGNIPEFDNPFEPAPVKPYTLMYVAKYNGPARGRIFDGLQWNWLSGFHGTVGVALHENSTWLIGNNGKHCDDCGPATPVTPEDINPDNWLLGTDMLNMYRANGIRRGWGTTNGNSRGLGLNYGWYTGLWREVDPSDQNFQASDWAVAEIVVFDRELGEAEVKGVEKYLYEKTQT